MNNSDDNNNENDENCTTDSSASPFDVAFTENLEVGKVYPIYGMITKFLETTTENDTRYLWIVVNQNLKLRVIVGDEDKVNLLRERSFEPGIFVTEIVDLNVEGYAYGGHCQTIIFGRKQCIAVN